MGMGRSVGEEAVKRNCETLFLAVLVTVAVALSGASAPQSPPAARPVADPEIIDADGYARVVAKHRGKPVMVNFWATWCPPCREEVPMVNDLAKKYADEGLVVIGVSVDDDGEITMVRRFLGRVDPSFANYRKKMGKTEAFNKSIDPEWRGTIPATFFYGRDGKLVHRIIGEAKREDLEKQIQELLAQPAAR